LFVNVHYDKRANQIHLWEQLKNKNLYSIIDWTPYVFVPHKQETNIKSIHGQYVIKKKFKSYNEYYNFQKDNQNVFENNVLPEIQFLAERYHSIADDDLEVPNLKIFSLDIEVKSDRGFPNVSEANAPIVLISVFDFEKNESYTFGLHDYTEQNVEEGIKVNYQVCYDELELLQRFFNFIQKEEPQVITGWHISPSFKMNLSGFDFPYIINRCKVLFGEDTDIYYKMSPIGQVRVWEKDENINVDIAGVYIIDYMAAYKWYSRKNPESYSLDFITKLELGKGKLEYEGSLNDLYNNEWNTYVDYNITDAYRIKELEDKLGYIKLIQSLGLITKSPMKHYQAMTTMLEGKLLTYFRRNNLCAPYFAGGKQVSYEGAFVKEPQKGLHKWMFSLDIASSYPHGIIICNMSPETYIGKISSFTEDQTIHFTKEKEFPEFEVVKFPKSEKVLFSGQELINFNNFLKRGMVSVAPSGACFKTISLGVISGIEKDMFLKRNDIKKKMRQTKSKKQKGKYNTFQHSLKILLNSMYGILAVPYSRYFNWHIAEAITSVGRLAIKQGEKYVNEFLNKENDKNDFVVYGDTDSLYIKGYDIIKYQNKLDEFESLSQEEKVKYIQQIAKEVEKYINDQSYEITQKLLCNSQEDEFKIKFNQEKIALSGMFATKKRYSSWILDLEGEPVDEMSITGMEIIRSDSPEICKPKIKRVLELILKNASDREIQKYIQESKKEMLKCTPEEIAENKGINNIEKYIYNKYKIKIKTPHQVKGVANLRFLVEKLKMEDEVEIPQEGNKAKVVYLKRNKFNIDSLSFIKWDKKFNSVIQVDIHKMIENNFTKKVQSLLEIINKENLLQEQVDIDMIFC